MVGYYERKWSASAKRCEYLALLCIPYFGLSILLHRAVLISSIQAIWLIAVGLALLLASLYFGVRALWEIWNKGHLGGGAALRGLVLALAMLAPFCWYGYLAVTLPLLSDVATDPVDPPQFLTAQALREEMAGRGVNQFSAYGDDYGDVLAAAYPKLGSRRYDAGSERVLASVRQLIEARGWTITATSELPDSEAAAEGPVVEGDAAEKPADAKPAGGKQARAANDKKKADEEKPEDEIGPQNFEVQAVARTLIFGFKSDIVVRIVSEEEASLVDMRAASRYGAHDFGFNARLIEKFLADLDASLVGIAGEG